MTSHNNTPSSRLWNRLRDIPRDPTDEECIAELVIVAFGAFERYYICWKNQKGQYRQGSYIEKFLSSFPDLIARYR
jgi:hypothetical protein